MKRIMYKISYVIFRSVASLIIHIYFRLRAEGMENLPKGRPFIIAANHSSFADPVVVQAVIPPNISWIAKKAVYDNRCLRFVHYIFRTIRVNGSVEKALAALEKGDVVGIFPEGTRSPDGKVRNGDVGVAVLALKSGMEVVPVAIKGAYEAFPRGTRFPRPRPITIKICKPVTFEKMENGRISSDILEEKRDMIGDRLREAMGQA
jgi:1-acyl-sn-glycerol-3-phosphate acyltransferase